VKRRLVPVFVSATCVVLALAARAERPDTTLVALSVDQFAAIQALVKPQGDEFAWYEEIPWQTNVSEARVQAAAQGKPLLVWSSADGHPCGAT
jgi:hypothetical protein